MTFQNTLAFAQALDKKDPLSKFRSEFLCPMHNGEKAIYFCGNSLGLQPKSVRAAINFELDYWAQYGVEGWFTGEDQWLTYHKQLSDLSAPIVGAKPSEVIIMNTLTINLHLMMVSFYRPTKRRFKIIMEAGAFPSDQYAIESQIRFHGFDPETAIVEIAPRAGERLLRTEDILQAIENQGHTVALVLFGGINYYTGQFYDLEKIAKAAHKSGAKVGFDLAHAAGNVPLKLHDWNADFAVWCSYKYMNSSPGGISGAFIHEKHHADKTLPRFAGWWGHDESQRFKMEKGFIPMEGASGWQASCVQVIPSAIHRASLKIFEQAGGIGVLREKSIQLTAFLEFVLRQSSQNFEIITPSVFDVGFGMSDVGNSPKSDIRSPKSNNAQWRGAQLSILTDENGKKLFDKLAANGVICDWREPNVIRLAPTPLYNSFEEVWRLGQLLSEL
jgi:kynureninase